MLIEISETLIKKSQNKKYVWNANIKDNIIVGNLWEISTQLFFRVPEEEIQLRDGKKGVDTGIDLIIDGQKIQCKSCYMDGKKNFILLDKTINYNTDYYSLGYVYEDYKQAEMVHFIKTTELVSLIEIGKICWHSSYGKWAYILNSSLSWVDAQFKKKKINEGVEQNISCFIYNL